MSTAGLLELGVALLMCGALVSLALASRRRLAGWTATLFVAAFAATAWFAVVRVFSDGAQPEVRLLTLRGLGASLAVALDPLSAFFLAIVATVALLATIYSVDYMTHYPSDGVAKFYPVLLIFLAGIVGVLASHDFMFFLVFWELMTLASFFLVVFERESAASQRAGRKYFIITHAATLCMVAAALLLWKQCGSFHFDALRDALAALLQQRPFLGHFVILLFFLGFATKAGILPMGAWLPDAHPVAPSGVSALLSGVLVKLGIYGLLRVFCGLVPVGRGLEAWGVVVALAGTASLFVGTLTALKQHDSKRLMAFHTIGQIGYVCLGLGVGLACLRTAPALGALALMGGLLHAANHACFKSCLFLGAGSVLYRTGERNMDLLGGLAASMPATAGSTTVASLAIAGVPPLNGFASKWLILVTCILAGSRFPLFLLLGVVGMFISLATLASFLKVLGAVFFGPESKHRTVSEVPFGMVFPQVVLAALCVVLGLVPFVPLRFARDGVAAAVQVVLPGASSLLGGPWRIAVTPGAEVLATWFPLVMALLLGLLVAVAYAIGRVARATVREVPVWNCGEELTTAEVRYPASSLYQPFKQAFSGIYPSPKVRAPAFPSGLRRAFDVDAWLYQPIVRLINLGARGVSRTHVGIPQVYLLWIVGGAIVVIGILLAVLG